MGKSKLTPKQEQFCKEYLIDLNATQAAIRAGYSAKTATVIGSDNLRKVNVAERIKELMSGRVQKTEVTADRILKELATIAFANADDFFEDIPIKDEKTGEVKGSYRQIKADILKSDKIAAIASFEPSAFGTKVKVYDKLKALDMLSRHVGLYNADTSQKPESQTNFIDLSNVDSETLRKVKKAWNESSNS